MPTSSLTQAEKEKFMRVALIEAQVAGLIGEVPIGAVIVRDKKVVSLGHNMRETLKKATAHAEMFAIDDACMKLENFRLENCQLFVTLEPCAMCSGAMILARVPEVYFGASDPKGGTAGSFMNLLEDERFNHTAYVEGGILADDCSKILSSFFRDLRARKKEKKLTAE